MLGSLDFYGFAAVSPTSGDNRIAAWAWTGLSALNSSGCASCSAASGSPASSSPASIATTIPN